METKIEYTEVKSSKSMLIKNVFDQLLLKLLVDSLSHVIFLTESSHIIFSCQFRDAGEYTCTSRQYHEANDFFILITCLLDNILAS